MVARLLWEQDAGGSSPFTPTKQKRMPCASFFVCLIESIQALGVCEQSRCLLWAMKPSTSGGRLSEAELAQRSKKTRSGESPMAFSGSARGGEAEDAFGVLFSATKQFTGLFCLRLVFTPTKQKGCLEHPFSYISLKRHTLQFFNFF